MGTEQGVGCPGSPRRGPAQPSTRMHGGTAGQADLGSRGTAGLGEPWGHHRNGNITGLGTSWESRGIADLGASRGHHRNGGIKDLGAS